MKLHNLNTRKNFKIKNLCLCIGNFDGVHLGHQHLIKKIIKNAKLNQLRSAILTFVPHPKIYFNREESTLALRTFTLINLNIFSFSE